MIIGFAGKKGSGKDLISQYLIDKYKYQRYAFADPVKDICRILFGFNEEQLHGNLKEEMGEIGIRPREAFQGIGTEFGRKYIHELFPTLRVDIGSIWIEIFKRNYKNNMVISDVRFQNEAEAIKEMGGIIILIDSKYSKEDGHESERIDVRADYVIKNWGTIDEFYENFDRLWEEIHK